jgi:hypothetical protein
VIYNVEADQGGTITIPSAVTESDGTPSNLAGYTGELEAWSSYRDDATLLATGSVAIDAPNGLVTGTIAASATASATWRSAVYDMKIVSGAVVEYVVRGTIKLRPTVT